MNLQSKIIKVLVVEDSLVVQELLVHILSSDPHIRVIGAVNNGEEALDLLTREMPDVITMDIVMPKMDGFEATRIIMQTNPVPIVIVSASWNLREVEKSFHAIEAGAVAVLEKPRGMGYPDYDRMANELVQTVKLMSEVKVVRRFPRHTRKKAGAVEEGIKHVPVQQQTPADIRLVVIGASTGGPVVVKQILSGLPGNFAVPVLIVQHIAAGFVQGLTDWLNKSSDLHVQIARHDECVLPGHVYIAPDGYQMKMEGNGKLSLTKDEHENGLCPSVSYLFRSVARVYGQDAVGVLLTGMGRDGAEELKLMKERGAITIAQDKESSIVHGMAGEAIRLGAATYVLPPDEIVSTIKSLVNKKF